MRIRHMLAARIGSRGTGLIRARRGGIGLAGGLAAAVLRRAAGGVVLGGVVLGGVVLGAPAHAAPPADPTLTGSTSGGPNQSLGMIFRWQKPPGGATDACGSVDFAFDSWPLGAVKATDQGSACAASYFGTPPLLDRAPGKHTVTATPTAAGVPARSATYTIVTPASNGGSATGRPSSAVRSNPATGATKPAQPRTATGLSGSTPTPSVTPPDPNATASPTVSASPPIVMAAPGFRDGGANLAWLLVLAGVLGLGATAALTAVVVRRSRRVEVEDL